jgi:hypothetical protein
VSFASFERSLGRRVTPDDARRRAGFALRLPRRYPAPGAVYLDRDAGGAAVTAVWRRAGDRARAVLTQWHPARLKFRKLLRFTVARPVQVDGGQGLWIEGEDHEVFYLDAHGGRHRGPPYLAGNTLIWQRDGTTYRLEADVDLEHALALAASLEE